MKVTRNDKNISKYLSSKRGSALIMALVTMTVLILLGLAVATLSMGTLLSSTSDASTNDAYYAAESGVNSALEQLKLEVADYYGAMLEATGNEYALLYDHFFENINSYAQTHFSEPAISGIAISTTFRTGDFDAENNTCEFLVTCTSTTSDNTSYVVNGSLKIKKVDVSSGQVNFLIDNAAIVAGDTLDIISRGGLTVNNGDLLAGHLTFVQKNKWSLPYSVNNGNTIIDPSIQSQINDPLSYPSFPNPVIPTAAQYITQNNFRFDWSNPPSAPVRIATSAGVSINFTSSCSGIPEGFIHVTGNVLANCRIYADIYCDGDFNASSGATIYGDVYCGGNFTSSGATIYGDIYCRNNASAIGGNIRGSTIYCDGTFNASSIGLSDTVSVYAYSSITLSGTSGQVSLFSSGPITLSRIGLNNSLIYSNTMVKLISSSYNAAIFSGGDIEVAGGFTVNGTMIAKNNIYYSTRSWLTVNYNQSVIDNVMNNINNQFFFSGSAQNELDENVFIDQNITAVGRVS